MTSFISELKRRNVVRVAIAYGIVSWVLIEISATVFPIVRLPEWTVTLVTMLLLLGFPVALILSWAFELTPEGIKREHDIDRSESITQVTGRKLNFLIIGLMAVGIIYLVVDKYVIVEAPEVEVVEAPAPVVPTVEQPAAAQDKSIAVLAFVNMSNDPEQEYFSDGIAEEILNGLVKVPDLRVAARTSAFSFKGQNIDVREIGQTLNVNHVLEGSVRKAGDRLRITAQLINVNDGYHLWSETFDRQADDIFAIQDEIALAVAEAMEVTLGLGDGASLVEQGTTDAEAYNWYLRGNYYIGQQSPEAFEKAIESYEMAIEIDPEFAGGFGGLAYGLAYGSIFYPYNDVAETVRDAYDRALTLNENQPQALLAKVVDLTVSNYDFVGAERAILQAMESAANKTLVVDAYWWIILQAQRRFDEGIAHLSITEEVDPLSPLLQQGLGSNNVFKGNYHVAKGFLETALELNPNDFFASWILVIANIGLGELDEAEAHIRQMEPIAGTPAWPLSTRAELLIARGDDEGARKVLDEMVALYDAGDTDPALVPMIGLVYAFLGDVDDAVDWFEIAAQSPNPLINTLPSMRLYNRPAVWNHPRFQAFVTKMNLDDASVAAAKAAVFDQ